MKKYGATFDYSHEKHSDSIYIPEDTPFVQDMLKKFEELGWKKYQANPEKFGFNRNDNEYNDITYECGENSWFLPSYYPTEDEVVNSLAFNSGKGIDDFNTIRKLDITYLYKYFLFFINSITYTFYCNNYICS